MGHCVPNVFITFKKEQNITLLQEKEKKQII